MSGAALTILLPDGTDTASVEILRARVGDGARAMTEGLGLPPPSLVVTRQGSEAVLLAAAGRHPLDAGGTAQGMAAVALHALYADHWSVLMAPALAARGVAATRWLRHAARRGLAVDELVALAEAGVTEEGIAWRLADLHPPALTLLAGREAIAALADEAFRKAAAMEAATQAGMPIPIPGGPVADPDARDPEVVVMIGGLRSPGLPPSGIGSMLGLLAPALVDPAFVTALLLDEARIPRRLGTLALAAPGPVAVAEALLRALETAPWPIDLQAVVEAAAGLAPPQ
jgi:hypothetical protein